MLSVRIIAGGGDVRYQPGIFEPLGKRHTHGDGVHKKFLVIGSTRGEVRTVRCTFTSAGIPIQISSRAGLRPTSCQKVQHYGSAGNTALVVRGKVDTASLHFL